MWQVVYIAPNLATAQKIQKLFEANGFLIQINKAMPRKKDNGIFEISVPHSEAKEACELLCDNRFR